MKLTPKQKIFVNEYLVDLNATRAYKAAYPNCKKEETINAAASRMLRNVKVRDFIDERMKEREKRTEITQDKVLNEIAKIAFANGTDFAKIVQKSYMKNKLDAQGHLLEEEEIFYNDVELVLTDDLPEDKKKAISGIKNTKYGIEVASCDKVRALELLGKHLGMFKDKVELSGNINNPYEGLSKEELLKIVGEGSG